MNGEENKQILAAFDRLLGADDLTPLDRLRRAGMVNHDASPLPSPGTRRAPSASFEQVGSG